MLVALTVVTLVPGRPPKDTSVTPTKLVLVIVTSVPPLAGPEGVVRLETVGVLAKTNALPIGVDVSSGNETKIVAGPTACAGATAVRCDDSVTTTFVAAPLSKLTVTPATKPLPVSSNGVPPAEEPLVGDTDGGQEERPRMRMTRSRKPVREARRETGYTRTRAVRREYSFLFPRVADFRYAEVGFNGPPPVLRSYPPRLLPFDECFRVMIDIRQVARKSKKALISRQAPRDRHRTRMAGSAGNHRRFRCSLLCKDFLQRPQGAQ